MVGGATTDFGMVEGGIGEPRGNLPSQIVAHNGSAANAAPAVPNDDTMDNTKDDIKGDTKEDSKEDTKDETKEYTTSDKVGAVHAAKLQAINIQSSDALNNYTCSVTGEDSNLH